MEKELTIKSKFFQQEDVVEVDSDEVDELINEEIEAGKINIPVTGTKLYSHIFTFSISSGNGTKTIAMNIVNLSNRQLTKPEDIFNDIEQIPLRITSSSDSFYYRFSRYQGSVKYQIIMTTYDGSQFGEVIVADNTMTYTNITDIVREL